MNYLLERLLPALPRTHRIDVVVGDLRQASRVLRHHPGYSLAALLTLALGIGANVTIFSLVNTVLLRPLPFEQPQRLVQVWESKPETPQRHVAPANFLDWRRQSGSFEHLAAYRPISRNLLGSGEAERINAASVSSDFFDVLGVGAAAGRFFRADETVTTGARQAVISLPLWHRKFGADPNVIGRSIRLDSELLTIVGVGAAGLDLPAGTDLWVQAPHDVPELGPGFEGDITTMRDAWYFRVVGRLRDGVDLSAAQSEMDLIAARLREQYPDSNRDSGIRLVDLHAQLVGASSSTLWLLLAAAGFVLLAACANVANLTLARAADRRRELAIRAAIGAGQRRLFRQLLTESVVLGLLGGTLGVGLALLGSQLLATQLPASIPRLPEVSIDLRVLAFALTISLATGLVFGLLPARKGAHRDLAAELRAGGTAHAGGHMTHTRELVLVAQIALASILVIGAGLMVRTMAELYAVDPGFRPEGRMIARLNLPGARDLPRGEILSFYEAVTEQLAASPSTRGVALMSVDPMSVGAGAGLRIEGLVPEANPPNAFWTVVTPDAFDVLGIPLRSGRGLLETDTATSTAVALVNETLARRHLGGDPIGQRINTGLDGRDNWVTVVGVLADTRNQGLSAAPAPMIFRPLAQADRFGADRMLLVVRSDATTSDIAATVRRTVRGIRSEVPIDSVRSLVDLVRGSVASPQLIARLLSLFALLALTLGAIGIYGVVTFMVSARRTETAIRVSLGARPSSVVWLSMRRSIAVTLIGVAAGVLGALVTSRILTAQLFNIAPHDPAVFATVPLVLAAVALLASWLPARRAARIDPMRALRGE